MSTRVSNKSYLLTLCKDFAQGDLTEKEFMEQVAEIRYMGETESFEQFMTTLDDATLGKLFRRVHEGTVHDTNWEGYSHEDSFVVMRYWNDMRICYENGINDDVEADSDRSKGGAVPDGA